MENTQGYSATQWNSDDVTLSALMSPHNKNKQGFENNILYKVWHLYKRNYWSKKCRSNVNKWLKVSFKNFLNLTNLASKLQSTLVPSAVEFESWMNVKPSFKPCCSSWNYPVIFYLFYIYKSLKLIWFYFKYFPWAARLYPSHFVFVVLYKLSVQGLKSVVC